MKPSIHAFSIVNGVDAEFLYRGYTGLQSSRGIIGEVHPSLPTGTYDIARASSALSPRAESDRDVHPLRGLLSYGPYSRSLINSVLEPDTH